MKRAWLHEAAKFCAGLVAADFLMGWWFALQSTLGSISFMGVTVTKEMIGPWLIIDVFLFLILVHYAWHVGKLPRVKERMYFVFAGAIFTVVCLAHLARIITGSEFVIFGWYVPVFLSWIGVLVTLYLAYASFHLAGRRK
ncbi:MAG TPA: hypothetical protein VHD38_01310 [Candidatus Paceibacterota bacterium]|nr:hypothetical protein [Candidatus Paceibacterota bacterium]